MFRLFGKLCGTKARPGAAECADHRAIRDLREHYRQAINFGDWDAFGVLFTADAVLEARAPVRMRFVGRAAIVKGLLQWTVGRRTLLVESASGLRIDTLEDGRARVMSTLPGVGNGSGTGAGLRGVAIHSGELLRQGGVWRFERCSIDLDGAPLLKGAAPTPGPLSGEGGGEPECCRRGA